MKSGKTTFVEVLYPGSFFPEESEHIVAEREPDKIAEKYPTCFSFQFYDQEVKEVVVDGATRTVRGPKRDVSPRYFPGGKIMTKSDIRKLGKSHEILLTNMECNNWPKVVQSRRGNFQPFDKNCAVI